jgi:hypothetical protein
MSLTLHAVIVKKPKTLEEAQEIAKHFIKNKKYHRETTQSYRFRNFPKNQFEPGSYKSKKLNEHTTLVFGKHKQGKDELVSGGSLFNDMIDKLASFLLRNNPLTYGIKHAMSQAKRT